MPESKLVEKLGFRVTENGDIVNLTTGFFIINEQSIRSLGSEKTCRIALWNLCLELSAENEKLDKKLNTPELVDFGAAIVLEAAHQRERWGSEHDAGKTPEDWFWTIGYLAGKALHSLKIGSSEKGLHHIITTAAVLNNWHAQVIGASNFMRPGLSQEKHDEINAAADPERKDA